MSKAASLKSKQPENGKRDQDQARQNTDTIYHYSPPIVSFPAFAPDAATMP